LAWKVDSELALRMSFGSEFQTFRAATQNARLAVSMLVHVSMQHRVTDYWRIELWSVLSCPSMPFLHLPIFRSCW